MGNLYTDKLNFRMPAEWDYGWHDEFWDNQFIKDVVMGAVLSQNRLISGGVVSEDGALTAAVAESVAYIKGQYYEIPETAGVALVAPAPEDSERKNWIYLNDVGVLTVSVNAPSGDYVPLALVDVSDVAVIRIADLRPVGYGDPEVLSAIDKVLSGITGTIVKAFRYDTTKDSDRSAWRERCSHLSWYNETLNTAARGRTRKFPADSLIVAETDKVTIFDLTDPDAPMWMVFFGAAWNVARVDITSIAMINGVLVIGHDHATTGGLSRVSFITEEALYYYSDDLYVYNSDALSDRNSSLNYSVYENGGGLINRVVNDVAMTIQDDAPIDPVTGIAVPTIGVATDEGASVIAGPAGVDTVVDIVWVAQKICSHINFDKGLRIVHGDSIASQAFCHVLNDIPTVSPPVTQGYQKGSYDAFYVSTYNSGYTGTDLVWLGTNDATLTCGGLTGNAFGSHKGLTLIKENQATPAKGLFAYITSSWTTGWNTGDVELCLSGENLTDKSVTATSVADNGVATFASAGTNTELQATTATGGAITAPVTTGQFCYGWEKISGDWLFRKSIDDFAGVSESGGTLTIADGTTFTLLKYTKGTPSLEDLTKFENDEKELFKNGAKGTIQGDSTDVKALFHDKDQDLLNVGTGDGVTTFRGLLAIDHLQDGVDVVSLAGGKGTHFIASASEVNAYVPATDLREEMARLSEQTKTYGGPLKDFWFTGDASETDFTLPNGWKAKHVYDAGLIKRPDSDYTIPFDGYAYAVSFSAAPGSGSDICVLAQREA